MGKAGLQVRHPPATAGSKLVGTRHGGELCLEGHRAATPRGLFVGGNGQRRGGWSGVIQFSL